MDRRLLIFALIVVVITTLFVGGTLNVLYIQHI